MIQKKYGYIIRTIKKTIKIDKICSKIKSKN